MEQTISSKDMRSLRFGGISPVVLRELSGVYQPFVKAVKEIISNAYDADAEKVILKFEEEYRRLIITDNGGGMNPIEFVRNYIRIGKSEQKDEFTSIKRRPRIGGKGIGFLAPARYCKQLEVSTKKNSVSNGKLVIYPNGKTINLEPLLLSGHGDPSILEYIIVRKFTTLEGNEVFVESKNGWVFNLSSEVDSCYVEYEFDSRNLVLTAIIDFDLLFSLDAGKSLEDIENFCSVKIDKVESNEGLNNSFTKIVLHDIKDFVRKELSKKGKKGARNIESSSGIEQFLWNLSRIIPVKGNIDTNIPDELAQFIDLEMDGTNQGFPIEVHCSDDSLTFEPLTRFIIQPTWKMDMEADRDLIRVLNYGNNEETGIVARGFIIGQTTTVFPAESRGILLRVKGVAVGEPTFFGLEQMLSGSAKAALSQISGEINIIAGVDAIHDINPGRDGFYKESDTYNAIKKALIGESSEKIAGDLKDIIDAIITRSEVNGSIQNFIKKHEAQRSAILEASAAISELSYEEPGILDEFFVQKQTYELQLNANVKYKAEGKLASYTVKVVDGIEDQYKIDYVTKELLLSSQADIWKKNINIAGTDFDILFKHGKQNPLFCEVNPKAAKIFINWDHPMRSSLGDSSFIKHCLATVASALPQEQLLTYIRLITNKI